MKFYGKLLNLLLVIALVPLILSFVLYRASMQRMGDRLTMETRTFLTENAAQQLEDLVDNFESVLNRDSALLQLAVEYQAREAERYLVAPFRKGHGGSLPIQRASQNVNGFALKAGGEFNGHGSMFGAYQVLQRFNPDLFHRQFTTLESGQQISFPAPGAYPPDHDPRLQQWYLKTKERGDLTRLFLTDLTTRQLMMVVSMPIFAPDGVFSGVTSIDVACERLLADWALPEKWSEDIEAMLLHFSGRERTLEILLHNQFLGREDGPSSTGASPYLISDNPQQMQALFDDVLAGRAGVQKLSYQGRESLWAYGAREGSGPFPLLIVPYEQIVAQAAMMEKHVAQQVLRGLQVAGLFLVGVIVWVVILSISRSRAVTEPVMCLADAAGRLSKGEFNVHVDIHSNDELEDLGQAFNDVGPQLKDREHLRESLALAKEIQQLLLPKDPPQLEGFDIAGNSVYCDETGGDYFDYIEVAPGKIGAVVGDVVGHGIGAALLMASASAVLRSHARDYGADLEHLIAFLNRYLAKNVGDAKFMTLFYGLLDVQHRSVKTISAGHGPALYYRSASKAIENIPTSGLPLGIMEDETYAQPKEWTLEPCDLLVIGTDGIWEARNPAGEMFGISRLRDIIHEQAAGSADEICSEVIEAVRTFRAEAPPDDDISLVVVKAV